MSWRRSRRSMGETRVVGGNAEGLMGLAGVEMRPCPSRRHAGLRFERAVGAVDAEPDTTATPSCSSARTLWNSRTQTVAADVIEWNALAASAQRADVRPLAAEGPFRPSRSQRAVACSSSGP
jgi:hypothetical protein